MRQITIEIDDDAAETLAARIDDFLPTVEDVARFVLRNATEIWEEVQGYRRQCRCQTLERQADDPTTPLVFDRKTDEYHILREGGTKAGYAVVYYCFFCGGRAPASKRDQLFARIPEQEKHRLSQLCSKIRTFHDAIRTFGPPEHDRPSGAMTEETDENGRRESIPYRALTYTRLSDVAEVRFTQTTGDQVRVSFGGKYLGEPEARGANT
jgi:hypothetical protein